MLYTSFIPIHRTNDVNKLGGLKWINLEIFPDHPLIQKSIVAFDIGNWYNFHYWYLLLLLLLVSVQDRVQMNANTSLSACRLFVFILSIWNKILLQRG